jgi:hypothetical protein
MLRLLRSIYPDHDWRPYHFHKPHQVQPGAPTSKGQLALFSTVKKLFPLLSVELNFRHPDLGYEKTSKGVEFDVSYITKAKLLGSSTDLSLRFLNMNTVLIT